MEHDRKKHPLVPRPGTDIAAPGRRTRRVMAEVTGDILARARAQDLGAARVPVGAYRLRAPDYRQILRWAEASGLAPEEVLERLAESSVEQWRFAWREGQDWRLGSIGFFVEDGAMVSVAWDFDVLPFLPGNWESGLLIRHLGLKGDWPDVATALRPVLPRLRTLSCGWLGLELLDLSPVPGLTELICGDNPLAALDLSPVPDLTTLDCGSTDLTELDLSPVPRLTKLSCWNNNLAELDLSPVPCLTNLRCGGKPLTKLDLSPVPGLTTLEYSFNNRAELDLSVVPGLTTLDCSYNKLTELDLSRVPRLTILRCGHNDLTELDLSPVPGMTTLD
jgi:hypothetical protein